jgi:hypothetical protein
MSTRSFAAVTVQGGTRDTMFLNRVFRRVKTVIYDTVFRESTLNPFFNTQYRRVEFDYAVVLDWSNTMSALYDLLTRMDTLETDLETWMTNFLATTSFTNVDTAVTELQPVISKTFSGTFASNVAITDTVNIAHGIGDEDLISAVVVAAKANGGKYKVQIYGVVPAASTGFIVDYDDTNIVLTGIQSVHQGQKYTIKVEYRQES